MMSEFICECGSHIFLTSQIPFNGQYNVKCENENCGSGFILNNELHYNKNCWSIEKVEK